MTATATTTMSQAKGAATRRSGRAPKARSLACRECRDRKIRCDGARPVCDSCSRRGLGADQCRYPEIEHEGSIASSRSYIRALQKRVQELEAREQQASLSPRSQNAFVGIGASHDDAWGDRPKAMDQPILPPIHAEAIYGFPGVGALPMSHDHYASHRAQMETSPPLTDDLENHSPVKSTFGSYSTNSRAALMLGKMSLPPLELMDDLLREYFDSDWIFMPLVHRPSFINKYDRLLAVSNSRYRRDIPLAEATELASTYCLLLGILALGEHAKVARGESVMSEAANGIEFHEQARGLLLSDLISTPSLPVVQALLVHARFLRSNNSIQESWVLVGLAHRLAEGLMLHVDVPGKTQAEREERMRTWCACAYMLRMQNVHNQATSSSCPEFGTLPQEVDDEYLEGQIRNLDRTQPPETPSAISFFTQSLRLSDTVLQPIQSTFFDSQNKVDEIIDVLSTTLKLDSKLQQWYDGLPGHLQVPQLEAVSAQRHSMFSRQAVLMRIRYLETKALIFRATIMKLAKYPASTPMKGLTSILLSGVIDSCYSASFDLIECVSYQKELLALAGVPESHKIISLCITGMTLCMMFKHPLFSDPRKTIAYVREIKHCLSIVKRCNIYNHSLADKYAQALEVAVPQQPQSPSSGPLDPALEAVRSQEAWPTDKTGVVATTEMAMLDAWYQVEPDTIGQDFLISEIVSFW